MKNAITCPGCKRKFYPLSNNQKWCTRKCGEKHRPKKKSPYNFGEGICEHCGAVFQIKHSDGQRFCSRKCAAEAKAHSKNTAKKQNDIRELIMITEPVPVFEHLQPIVGRLYEARRGANVSPSSKMFWIVEVSGKPVVVREGECCVIGGVSQ